MQNKAKQNIQAIVSVKKDKVTHYWHVMLGNVSMYKNTNKAFCVEWKLENFPDSN